MDSADNPPTLDIGCSKGKIVQRGGAAESGIGGWRVSIEHDPQGNKLVEFHARLMNGDQAADRELDLPVDAVLSRWRAPGTSAPCRMTAPLAMPVQSLRQRAATRGAARRPHRARIGLRRRFVVLAARGDDGGSRHEMYRVLAVNGPTPLAIVMLALFVALFAWIALSFVSSLAGFFSLLAGGGRSCCRPQPALPATRTALLMPTYNEQPSERDGRAAGDLGIAASRRRRRIGSTSSSSATPPTRMSGSRRKRRSSRCAQRTGDHAHIFYRHRSKNTARKAGNIADWVTRFGGAYPQFLILDADSVMDAAALLSLVNAMEAHPDVGLIQTLPIITGGSTLFARMQQFAGRVYGPLIAHGIAWWHGSEGNYWGHNALIRTRAFAEQAGLPELRGRKPFGGHILSHDFVEAALIRRGGWAVHMVPALRGSYEGAPPSLTDLAIRDRRWCQGNLQHAAVLPARGLHWVSRMHLLTGIGSYVTAPLWLLFLLAGILISIQARFVPPNYFPARQVAVPQLAGDRSGARHVDVRRHHGPAAAARSCWAHRRAAARARIAAAAAARCGCWRASCWKR